MSISTGWERPVGTHRRRLALRVAGAAAGAVLILALGWFAWLKAPAAPSARLHATLQALATRHCAALEVIGVRGHGDPPSDVGPDVHALILRLQARLGEGRQADVVPLPYEQTRGPWGAPLWVPRDVITGARALEEYVGARAAACPQEPRVLIAQSEGAALAHLAIPRIAASVRATVLLGDPLHLSSAPYNENLGPTPNGSLVPVMGFGIDVSRWTWVDPVPSGLASKIRSYCLPHDHVCGQDLFDRQTSAHLDYRDNRAVSGSSRGVLDLAVDFIVARLSGGAAA